MEDLSKARFSIRESETRHLESTKKLFLDLIEALDAFERVFRNISAKESQVTPQMKIWVGNFRTVRRLLDKPLAEQGVVRIENLDQGFDPHWHRVAEVISDPSKSEGAIIDELAAGYVWRGHVLRKAEVTVVGPPQEAQQESREGK
ncbi:MAG: nucleotide exchange factor GrpE [Planctomycetota bacterium]|nr:nucleotide exchange factor GrpE [Planctomycetota bacterium]